MAHAQRRTDDHRTVVAKNWHPPQRDPGAAQRRPTGEKRYSWVTCQRVATTNSLNQLRMHASKSACCLDYNSPVPFDPKDPRHLVIALGLSALGGAAIVQSHHDEAAKSHAERDDPDGCASLCDLIWDLLDDWQPEDCNSEDEYTDDLVEYLRANLDGVEAPDDSRRIKVAKRVRKELGIPDVRIDDRLVLELKVGPHEGEKDRLIGQCCKYSVEWVTWAVVIDNQAIKSLNVFDGTRIEEIEKILQIRHLYTHQNGIVNDRFHKSFPAAKVNDEYRMTLDEFLNRFEYLAQAIKAVDEAARKDFKLAAFS
jgi:hypothetical protein